MLTCLFLMTISNGKLRAENRQVMLFIHLNVTTAAVLPFTLIIIVSLIFVSKSVLLVQYFGVFITKVSN